MRVATTAMMTRSVPVRLASNAALESSKVTNSPTMNTEGSSKKRSVVEEAEECATYLKALGDSNRLQIMKALRSSPLTVTDICLLLETEMANVSHHLRVLFHAGLVTTQREGKYVYYQINKDIFRSKMSGNLLDLGCCSLEMRN